MLLIVAFVIALFDVVSWSAFAWSLPLLFVADTLRLWNKYLGIMNLAHTRNVGKLPSQAKPHGTVLLLLGYIEDVAYNLTWASLIYLDPPRELLVTARMVRYKFGRKGHGPETGWRLTMTNYFCDAWLDPFDHHESGKHVRP